MTVPTTPTISLGSKGVPPAWLVRAMLTAIGPTTAVKLCGAFRVAGYNELDAQLGITRAIDAGHVLVRRDLSLIAAPKVQQ